jgi:hypothetical protein
MIGAVFVGGEHTRLIECNPHLITPRGLVHEICHIQLP